MVRVRVRRVYSSLGLLGFSLGLGFGLLEG